MGHRENIENHTELHKRTPEQLGCRFSGVSVGTPPLHQPGSGESPSKGGDGLLLWTNGCSLQAGEDVTQDYSLAEKTCWLEKECVLRTNQLGSSRLRVQPQVPPSSQSPLWQSSHSRSQSVNRLAPLLFLLRKPQSPRRWRHWLHYWQCS